MIGEQYESGDGYVPAVMTEIEHTPPLFMGETAQMASDGRRYGWPWRMARVSIASFAGVTGFAAALSVVAGYDHVASAQEEVISCGVSPAVDGSCPTLDAPIQVEVLDATASDTAVERVTENIPTWLQEITESAARIDVQITKLPEDSSITEVLTGVDCVNTAAQDTLLEDIHENYASPGYAIVATDTPSCERTIAGRAFFRDGTLFLYNMDETPPNTETTIALHELFHLFGLQQHAGTIIKAGADSLLSVPLWKCTEQDVLDLDAMFQDYSYNEYGDSNIMGVATNNEPSQDLYELTPYQKDFLIRQGAGVINDGEAVRKELGADPQVFTAQAETVPQEFGVLHLAEPKTFTAKAYEDEVVEPTVFDELIFIPDSYVSEIKGGENYISGIRLMYGNSQNAATANIGDIGGSLPQDNTTTYIKVGEQRLKIHMHRGKLTVSTIA